eukprot:ANDGO_07730.mRNA.1 THO complex subunit 4A
MSAPTLNLSLDDMIAQQRAERKAARQSAAGAAASSSGSGANTSGSGKDGGRKNGNNRRSTAGANAQAAPYGRRANANSTSAQAMDIETSAASTTSKRNNRRRNNSNKNQNSGNNITSSGVSIGAAVAGVSTGAVLSLTNLASNIVAEDLKEIFAGVGPLKRCTVHYDRDGRSMGTAEVVFTHRKDALEAFRRYNQVTLDGRPMVLLVLEPRVEPKPNTGSGKNVQNAPNSGKKGQSNTANQNKTATKPGPKAKKTQIRRPGFKLAQKTKEQLDQELSSMAIDATQ